MKDFLSFTTSNGLHLYGFNRFHPPTSHGHCYALTAVCMLIGFTWCIPLKTKTAEEVAKAYLDHIYSLFGGSVKILMDNGTEFKNKLIKEVVSKLAMEFSIHSPPYRPQSNGKIGGFHRFLKACIAKHINHGLEWDELTPMATACYNFFPNCSARESAFFIMFGQLHLQRSRDHQVVISDQKQSSKLPPYSKDNQNTIQPQWTHWNAIQIKQRSTKCKLHQKFIL